MPDDKRQYIGESWKQFGIDTEQSLDYVSRYYVEVPVQWVRGAWDQEEQSKLINSPFELLAPSASEEVYPLSTPYIAMIIGPSGVGKTEFIRQLCRFCASFIPESPKGLPLRVLPVRLVDCKWDVFESGRKPSPEQFRDFLFSRLMVMNNSILEDIAEGSLLLALDGLDELITRRSQHDVFFECLHELLAPYHGRGRHRIRIVITCRLDYLRALNVLSADDIVPDFREKMRESQGGVLRSEANAPREEGDRSNADAARLAQQMAVHFLRLDFFSDARIKGYLARRGLEQLWRYVKRDSGERHPIGEIMQRPLFLKLLCDMADTKPGREAFDIQNITDVMNSLVEWAVKTVDSPWTWGNDDLARSALQLFKARRMVFESEAEVAPIVRRKRTSGVPDETPPDLFEAVHKCPFLRREGCTLRFTHQVFYQYFVARGMFLSLRESEARGDTGTTDFDRWVLTVEMRHFLRDLVGNDVWLERTRKSFALDADSLADWPRPDWIRDQRAKLEGIRLHLLRYMTEPEANNDDAVGAAIVEFLAMDSADLHPRYLLACHEALAIYVGEHRWGEQNIEGNFENRIRKDLEAAIRALKREGPGQRLADDLGRLVLRIIDIGFRLRLPTVLRWANRQDQLKLITGDTREQLKGLQEQIQANTPAKRKTAR